MSQRQIKKQLDKEKGGEESISLEDINNQFKQEQPKKSAFQAFQMIESEEDEAEEENENQEQDKSEENKDQEQKKKKKKNRKKKKKQTQNDGEQEQSQSSKTGQKQDNKFKNKEESELEFLDKVINETKEEQKHLYQGRLYHGSESILKMDRKDFSYKRELKQLFAKSAQQYGALGIDEDEKEERKQARGDMEEYEGASKKMKRRLRMVEKMQERNRVVMAKKYLLVQPNPKWPRVPKMLNMEQVRTDKQTGQKVFTYVKTPEYVSLQKEFEQVQQTMDISYLVDFLRKNFYHHESLLYFADFLRLQGKFTDAFHCLERCLFAFENAWTFDYQPVPPEKSQDVENFVPQTRLDLDREHLNKVFCECLVKYIDLIGRKGCSRTSLEFCKLLLSISPQDDPYGALLRIDYYAYRAKEYSYFIKFIKQFPKEIYHEKSLATILILPNLLMSASLSQIALKGDEGYTINNLEQTLDQLLNLSNDFDNILDIAPEATLIAAILLYPGIIESLIQKCGQKQINSTTKKSYFQGYQAKTWTEILSHQLFTEIGDNIVEYHPYSWLLTDEEIKQNSDEKQEELVTESMNKIYQIFITRSSQLFSSDHTLLWMKEVIGFVLNKIDDGSLDRDLFIAKVASVTDNAFAFSRYRHLKVSDYSDDITTINPNELMMGGAGPGQGIEQNLGQGNAQEAGEAAQQLQQMINQLRQNQPPQLQQQQLIQQQNVNNMNEEDLQQMQEALIAQMGQEENLQFGEDEEDYGEEDEGDEDNEGNQDGGNSGLLNYFQSFIPGWNPNNNNNNTNNEEEKKQ